MIEWAKMTRLVNCYLAVRLVGLSLDTGPICWPHHDDPLLNGIHFNRARIKKRIFKQNNKMMNLISHVK